MTRPFLVALLAIVGIAPLSAAQIPERSIEVFGTFGGIAGVTPVRALSTSRVGVHGGLLFDAGIQGEHLAVAGVLRGWELAPTQTYGGLGIDATARAEWRMARSDMTTFRAAAGAGFDEIDGGRGPDRSHSGTQGLIWSIGAARELYAPSGALLILSADIVMPHVNGDIDGRRAPILEFGFGYRARSFHTIRILRPRS